MNILLIIFVWLLMGAVLVAGVVMAVVKGAFWLLILGLIGFVSGVIKYGILSH
jgi:hypothetical protein